jgi:hypothetical protein
MEDLKAIERSKLIRWNKLQWQYQKFTDPANWEMNSQIAGMSIFLL